MKNNINEHINDIKGEEHAIDSSIALNKILSHILNDSKKREARLWAVIIALIAVIALMSVLFVATLNNSEYLPVETTMTNKEIEMASNDESEVSYFEGSQYNDNATHNDNRGGKQ